MSLPEVLHAIHQCCLFGGRDTSLSWVDLEQAFNL
jgi:hypothetical protein